MNHYLVGVFFLVTCCFQRALAFTSLSSSRYYYMVKKPTLSKKVQNYKLHYQTWDTMLTTFSTSQATMITQLKSTNKDSSSIEEEKLVEADAIDDSILKKIGGYLENIKKEDLHTITLSKFMPLGCTAEESLNTELDGSTHVFLSKVQPDGNACLYGLQTGDVIVGVSGSFHSDTCSMIVETVGVGLDKVKSLIAGRDEYRGDNLVLKVIRGSDVMSDHDSTLVDMCILPEKDADIDNCIDTLYSAEYDMKKSDGSNKFDYSCEDTDLDCMLDAMFEVWDDESEGNILKSDSKDDNDQETSKKRKPAPWSSRSSPSGTFVRDPRTGKMVNIDE